MRDITNNAGTVQDSITYSAFGKITAETNSANRGRYAWSGRELDVETALQYNRARYYHSNTGRWLVQDPLGFAAGDSNLYRYVHNQPTDATDPTGLATVDIVYMTFIPEKRVIVPNSDWTTGLAILTLGITGHIIEGSQQFAGDDRGFTRGDPMAQPAFRTRVSLRVNTWDSIEKHYAKATFSMRTKAGLSIRYTMSGIEQERKSAEEDVHMFHKLKDKRVYPILRRTEYNTEKYCGVGAGAEMTGVAYNPLYSGLVAPAIDYSLTYQVKEYIDGRLYLNISGNHDGFPNHEMFARVNNGSWISLYKYDHVAAGKGPTALFGAGGTEFRASLMWDVNKNVKLR